MTLRYYMILMLTFLCLHSTGQLSISAISMNNTIQFNASVTNVTNGIYTGAGLAPNPTAGQLDSDAWRVSGINGITTNYGDTQTSGDFALGTALVPVTQGGLYSFSGSPLINQAFGMQPAASVYSGSTGGIVELKCQNNTLLIISEVQLNYSLYARNDQNRSSTVNASITQDFFTGYTNITKFDLSPLDYTSVTNAGPAGWTSAPKYLLVTGLNINPGEYFYITWTIADAAGSGSRDEFALDNINVRANIGVSAPTFYSQNSSTQTNTSLGGQLWSTHPNGVVKFGMAPFIPEADYVVQNGNTVTFNGSGPSFTLDDLTVESGGILRGDNAGNNPFLLRYMCIKGSILNNGQIGAPGGGNSNLGFNIEPGDHTISGSGSFNCSRIRKSDDNLLDGVCNLNFQQGVTFHYLGNALYNGRAASGGGTNNFNITVSAGATVHSNFHVGIDGSVPSSNNGIEAGGTIDVYGTLEVERIMYMRTDNSALPCSTIVRNGGNLIIGESYNAGSGAAKHALLIEGGGILNFLGSTSSGINTWNSFTMANNVYSFLPGSTIIYSKNNSQNVLTDLEYRNLILTGTGGAINRTTWSPSGTGQLTIRENLNIVGNAKLIPGVSDILINGIWTSYGEIGLTEGTGLAIFENLTPGASAINTSGGEQFFHMEIRSGTVTMNSNIDVIDDFDLYGRLNLNSRNLLIRNPIKTTLGASTQAMVVSEDTGHLGTMTVTVNSYTGPVDFPFGTSSGQPIYCQFKLNSGNAGQVTMATYPTGANNIPRPSSPQMVNNLISSTGLLPDNQAATVDRYWSIVPSGTTMSANLSLSFLGSEMPTLSPFDDVSAIRAQRYDVPLNRWQPSLPSQVVLQNSPSAGIHRIDIPNVTQFSPWAAASDSSPLPIELLSFDGKEEEEGIRLDWVTASELNNSHFSLSRFSEFSAEKELTTVFGAGNSSSLNSYSYLDDSPDRGWNYYRLTQVDFDGTSSDEGLLALRWEPQSSFGMISYQWNLSGLVLTLSEYENPLMLRLYDLQGRLIYADQVFGALQFIPFSPDTQGIYLMTLENGLVMVSEKLIFIAP